VSERWRRIDYTSRDTAEPPFDGDDVLVGVEVYDTWIVHAASWNDGQSWKEHGFSSREAARGWWTSKVSWDGATFSQESVKLRAPFEPAYWMPDPDLP